MDLLVAEIIQRFYLLLWPMTRISAFLLAAPFFSLQSVTVRIRVLFALALTLMIYPLVDWPYIEPDLGRWPQRVAHANFYRCFDGPYAAGRPVCAGGRWSGYIGIDGVEYGEHGRPEHG